METGNPLGSADRVQEIDVVRGFALFGVLWINLVTQTYTLAPDGAFDNLPTAPLDEIMGVFATVFMTGKAMALFSLLFGFGFAMIMQRMDARGVDGQRIFLRRMAVLLLIGLVHILFIWFGDILHLYALMGFLLLATRRWSSRWLLAVGLVLSICSWSATEFALGLFYERPFPWLDVYVAGAERRFDVVLGSSYPAYVTELWRSARQEMWGTPDYIPYMLTALGRFMIGAWIFRQGWLQDVRHHRAGFRRAAWVLVIAGMVVTGLMFALDAMNSELAYGLDTLPELVLALGYGAALIALCGNARLAGWLQPLGDVGRMALTNYLLQSIVYLFVLFGFGLGLLRVLGGTLCLAIAVAAFAMQTVFSCWWLSRYRFGPVEWIWRTLTYGHPPPLRIPLA